MQKVVIAVLIFYSNVSYGETINLNDPRPLAQAARLVQKRFSVPINYEDTYYISNADVAPLGRQPRVIPTFRALSVTIPALLVKDEKNQYETAFRVIRSVVAKFNAIRGADLFRVFGDGRALTIQSIAYVDGHDHLQPLSPLLDRVITLKTIDLPYSAAIERVLALAVGGSRTIVPGTINLGGLRPINGSQLVSFDIKNRPAREAMSIILQKQTMKPAWKLYCPPSPDMECALNVDSVDETPQGLSR